MNHSDFIHLHVHSQYSLLDGACRLNNLIKKAVEYGMSAVAVSDHGNMFGAIEFYQEALKAGIKPILGYESYIVTTGTRLEKRPRQKGTIAHLNLYACNNKGYHNLLKLVSSGYLEGFYYYPRIDKEILSKYAGGLIGTSSCIKGEVPWHLIHGNYNEALKAADEMIQIFGKGNFYLELMDHGLPEQKVMNEGLLKISKQLGIPLIVTNDVHYLEQSQAIAHEVLVCIQTQSVLSDEKRMRMKSDQFYFKSPEQMRKDFAWAPQDALLNTMEIAEKCNIKLEFDKIHLPRFDLPDGKTKEEFLRELCLEGLKKRYTHVTDEIIRRLEHELRIIEKMGFVGYFLIVWDFINYAKRQGIPVGPGRGSAAGSLVSYLTGITNLDPIKYGLLFERFLNPDRSGMPDIDIDFCYERRGEVIEYVNKKYGRENVAQIITFGTMQARAAIRDVGRVLGVPYSEVDKIAKLIPSELGITLDDAIEKEPRLAELCKQDENAAKIIEIARILEGLNRHVSTHAAGVVISDKPLNEHMPLFKTSDGQITTGYAMKEIAKIGLLKIDFLGLRTLTVIDKASKLIEKRHGIRLDMNNIPLDDKNTYELLSRANSFGVFQLESAGMRELLKKIKPTEFEDIIAVLALYRPGPMGSGMLDDFIKRKKGLVKFDYDHPKLEPILKETYGIIVYQEQVMKIPVALAGFSMTEADHLRRAMSKKIASVMEKMRVRFVEGCKKHSRINEAMANKLFDLIDYFSGYGFNRSHSAAYAMVSYQTAYLKANYPVEFMCALLNSEQNNTDKIVEYVKECESMGIKILPPDINESIKDFDVVEDNIIRFGLLAVKNVGATAIDSIVEQRQHGRYTSLYDFCERVDLRLVNKKVIESLIKCGAFDCFGVYRSQLMAIVEKALEIGARKQKEKALGQVSFLDFVSPPERGGTKLLGDLPAIKEWRKKQMLALEKEILGFYVSGHPLSHYQVEIREFTDISIKDLRNAMDGEDVRLVGIINQVKLTTTRKSKERMAILRIEDMDAEVEVVVFPSAYKNLEEYIKEGEVIFLKGKVNFRDEEVSIIAEDMRHIHDVYQAIKSVNLTLSDVSEDNLIELRKKLEKSPGTIPVYLHMNTKSNKGVEVVVGEDFFITPNENLINDIKELIGDENFSVNL